MSVFFFLRKLQTKLPTVFFFFFYKSEQFSSVWIGTSVILKVVSSLCIETKKFVDHYYFSANVCFHNTQQMKSWQKGYYNDIYTYRVH